MHDGYVVGDFGHHTEVVGDENHAHARFGLQLSEKFQDFQLYGHVQGGGRLVGDKQLGVAGDGHGNHHTLFLSARELMWIAVVDGFRTGQHHLLEEADDTLLGSCFAHCFVLQNHLTNLIAAFIDRVERGHGLLENHGNAFASYFGHLLFAEAFDFLAFDLDAVGFDTAHLLIEEAHHGQRTHRFA